MRKKKRIRSFLTILMVLGMCIGMLDCPAEAEETFDYGEILTIDSDGVASFKAGYAQTLESKSMKSLVLPDSYNGQTITKYKFPTNKNNDNNVTESLTMNNAYNSVGVGDFATFKALKKLIIPYTGSELTFQGDLAKGLSNGSSNSIDEIYLYASGVSFAKPSTCYKVFEQLAQKENFRIYVTDKDMPKAIAEGTRKSTGNDENGNPTYESVAGTVSLDKIIFQQDENKKKVSITLNCENITVGKKGGFVPIYEIKDAEGNKIEVPEDKIKINLYEDADGVKINDSYVYNQDNLPIRDYYIGVVMEAFDDYSSAKAVIPVKVEANKPTNKEALKAAIDAAIKFQEENQYIQANYDKTAWNNVYYGGQGALGKAKEIFDDTEGKYNQEKVDEATKNLTDALDALKNAKADNTEAWNQLQETIKKAEAVIPDKDKYTDESWTLYDLPKRIEEAKALDKNAATSTVQEIQRHISLLNGAIDGLKLKPIEPVVKPGNPFAYIPKKGSQVKVLSMTAPENLAGATKVRVTFQCADDVSFNEYASIDIDPVIAGTSNYVQIKGTGDYTTGKSYTVDVPLSAAIKAGDSIEIIMATFAWDDAKDYVYGVTAIEFLDAADKSLGAYTDKDVYKENLASAIKEAEAINTSTYTAESVEKLTKALEAAKALKEDATAEEMKKAIDDLNDAIKGLEKKDDEEEARVKLTAKIKEAEAIDTSLYTPESVEKLTKALEAAKALKEDASEEEINKVMADIEAAINGLVKKDGNGGNDDPQPPKKDEQTKVIGVAKGKTFAAGSVKYKVSVAATMTGTVKTAGKVTVVGLSSKKKTSVNVKNTVSVSGASYQVTGIASKAFRKAAKLKKATLGSNIKSIPTSAFESCKKLTTVKATGVTKIGSKAFKGCKVLKKLTFGKKKLSSVKKGAFKGCKKTIKVAGGSKKVKKGNVKKLKKSGYKKFK